MNKLLNFSLVTGVMISLGISSVQAQIITGMAGFPSPFVGRSSLQILSTYGRVPITVYNDGSFEREYVGPTGAVTPSPIPDIVIYEPTIPAQATGLTGTDNGFNGNSMVTQDGSSVKISANGNLYGNPTIPRTSDSIEAKIEKDDRLTIKWAGEPRSVARITFALLDRKKDVLKQSVITRLPAEGHFTITPKTSYYQVYVEYINGTTTSVISPL